MVIWFPIALQQIFELQLLHLSNTMIKSSLQKTLSIIAKNKTKILLIFFLQILFFIALSLIFYHTLNPAMEHAKNALDYYDKINTTQAEGMSGIIGEEPFVIYDSYKKMMYYLELMALFSIISFIVINGVVWAFSDDLINKKDLKQFLAYLFNFGIISLAFILVEYALIFNTFKVSLLETESNGSLFPLIGILLLSVVLIYFFYISLSIIDKRNLKEIARLTFLVGIFKFPFILLIYLINLIIFGLFSYLIYLTIELNIAILSIVVILFVCSFVFVRLFLIIGINDLVKKL